MFDRYEEACRLMRCFPGSFINNCGEVILHQFSNTYFRIEDCESLLDVQCKILEHTSRAAFKTEPYGGHANNKKFHEFIRHGINLYLGTDFDEEDMETIYTYLGNGVNHKNTIKFIRSCYDFSVLEE